MKLRKVRRTNRPRRGFSLVEIMVAMGFLAIVLMSLTKIGLIMAMRSRDNSTVAKRTFALIRESNKFGAMPYATLTAFSTTAKTDTIGDFYYTRTLSITTSGNNTTVKIKITPTRYTSMPDSVFLYRSKPAVSPLCTTC
jgi:prepilin-type N-terminal cleavage/methylation domain-containing protein